MNQRRECRRCNLVKPIEDFQQIKSADGIKWRRVCRSCKNQQHKEWREKNAEHVKTTGRERMRKWRESMPEDEQQEYRARNAAKARERNHKLRLEVFEAYGGFECACCGETEPKFLSIDHINNDGYQMRKDGEHGSGYGLYIWLKREGYPEGFQVLCMNCQHGKARNGGICPHQTRCNDHPERE